MIRKSQYTTNDVAQECGLTRSLVARYFRTVNPRRASYTWNVLSETEFDDAVAELRECMKACPKQPLHGLTKIRGQREMVTADGKNLP